MEGRSKLSKSVEMTGADSDVRESFGRRFGGKKVKEVEKDFDEFCAGLRFLSPAFTQVICRLPFIIALF